jgi:competence protein ComEC
VDGRTTDGTAAQWRWRRRFAVGEPTVPVLAAAVVAVAAWLRAPLGALALAAVAGAVVGRWRVGVSIAAVALIVALRSVGAEDGLVPDELGRYTGWAIVAADPDPAFDATRLLLQLDGERFEVWVRGRAAQLRVGAWSKGDLVWVDGTRRRLDPERAGRVAWQHVVGAFDAGVLGDRLPGSRVDVASNRVRALITNATEWLPGDDAALARGLIIGDDSDETACQVVICRRWDTW